MSRQVEPRGGETLRFEPNLGQWDGRVEFVARAGGGVLFITDDAVVVTAGQTAVTLKLVGARKAVASGEEPLASRSNYFLGDDPSKWRSNVPNFARVRAREPLPGVDVVWHGGPGGVEYDVEVAAGVDARQLEWAFDAPGEVAPDGSLHIGEVVQRPARVIQSGRELATRYVAVDATHVRLEIDGYRPEEALLIDPVLTYSTYLGGSGSDSASSVAVDSTGNVYITGTTSSTDFPTHGAFQGTAGGGGDAFVTKLNPAGSAVIYSTYLGGSGGDGAAHIAVDSAGDAYIVGSTSSTNFPTHAPIQAANAGNGDMFVVELNAAGSGLVYSTYLGGSAGDGASGLAIDSAGNAYLIGTTKSTNFPTLSAFQSTPKAACSGNDFDVVVAKVNSSGSALAYSTYLSGCDWDQAAAITVDTAGSAYVTGWTQSPDFPTQAPLQTCGGVFITKLTPAGNVLSYSTCLHGSLGEQGNGIAVDGSGNAYVTGFTGSNDFPTVNPIQAAKRSPFLSYAAFVSKLNPTGSALVYSTYLTGTGSDSGTAIVVDGTGSAIVVGSTTSKDFPIQNAFQPVIAGGRDAFIAKLTAAGDALTYSTYLGGAGTEGVSGVALDGTGGAHIVGATTSTDFPVVSPVQVMNAGGTDAFIATVTDPQLAPGAPCTPGACASTFCVDGFCCGSACTGRCEACDVDGSVGTCVPVAGSPHVSHPACDDAGTTGVCAPLCDGTDPKTCAYPGTHTVCGSVCKEAAETDQLCDGVGHCGGPGRYNVRSCGGLTCTADGGTCKPSCNADSDCLAGYTCANGQCVIGTSCINEHTSQPPYGAPEDCTPYKCAGGCKTSCTSIDDCVAPNVCGLDGRCEAAQPSASNGCGCRVAATRSDAGIAAVLGVGLALVARRRRRRGGN